MPDVAEDDRLRLELALQLVVQRAGDPYLLHGHRTRAPVETVGVGDAVHVAGTAAADEVLLFQLPEYGRLPEAQILDERRDLPLVPDRDARPFLDVADE
jgi:hypothetical protein